MGPEVGSGPAALTPKAALASATVIPCLALSQRFATGRPSTLNKAVSLSWRVASVHDRCSQPLSKPTRYLGSKPSQPSVLKVRPPIHKPFPVFTTRAGPSVRSQGPRLRLVLRPLQPVERRFRLREIGQPVVLARGELAADAAQKLTAPPGSGAKEIEPSTTVAAWRGLNHDRPQAALAVYRVVELRSAVVRVGQINREANGAGSFTRPTPGPDSRLSFSGPDVAGSTQLANVEAKG